MFEELRNHVILYFTEVTSEQICAPFIINENSIVEERKNSTAKIYDYYKPEFEAQQVCLIYKLSFKSEKVSTNWLVYLSCRLYTVL